MSRTVWCLVIVGCLATAEAARADAYSPARTSSIASRPEQQYPLPGKLIRQHKNPMQRPFGLFPINIGSGSSYNPSQAAPSSPLAIPEPQTLAIFGTGLLALALRLRGYRAKSS